MNINVSTRILLRVISINNRCVDQLSDENIISGITELQSAVSLIKQMVMATSNAPAFNVEVPNKAVPEMVQHQNQSESSSSSSLTPPPTPATMMVRIQFRNDALSTSTLASSDLIPTTRHSKSPIVACLHPIRLVTSSIDIDSVRMENTIPSLQQCTDRDLHLVSTAVLLNIGMMFHRFALRYSDHRDDDDDDNEPSVICDRAVPPRGGMAPYWMRTTELYELLITLFRNNDQLFYTHGTNKTTIITGMNMMKTIVYNNYAQICYDMGDYTRYISCMTSLLHHQVQFNNDAEDSTYTTTTTTTTTTTNSDETIVAYYYEPIRQTIQLNVWICQILAVPIIARAA